MSPGLVLPSLPLNKRDNYKETKVVNATNQLRPTLSLKAKESRNDKHASSKLHYLLRSRTFRAFILCGIIGVSIDIDHFISYLAKAGLSARFLHIPIIIIIGCVFCCLCAYLGGLLLKVVLRHLQVTTSAKKLKA
jgi:hypothetical protein